MNCFFVKDLINVMSGKLMFMTIFFYSEADLGKLCVCVWGGGGNFNVAKCIVRT